MIRLHFCVNRTEFLQNAWKTLFELLLKDRMKSYYIFDTMSDIGFHVEFKREESVKGVLYAWHIICLNLISRHDLGFLSTFQLQSYLFKWYLLSEPIRKFPKSSALYWRLAYHQMNDNCHSDDNAPMFKMNFIYFNKIWNRLQTSSNSIYCSISSLGYSKYTPQWNKPGE